LRAICELRLNTPTAPRSWSAPTNPRTWRAPLAFDVMAAKISMGGSLLPGCQFDDAVASAVLLVRRPHLAV
jgi:hypothetical protein